MTKTDALFDSYFEFKWGCRKW